MTLVVSLAVVWVLAGIAVCATWHVFLHLIYTFVRNGSAKCDANVG